MKKRIIAFILVVVMSALCLVSCSYSFRKDDMDNYVEFDAAKFAAALLSKTDIMIEDGEFGTDETVRWAKVDDAIYALLVTEAGTTNFQNTGKADKYSVYYYCYYVTHTDDEGVVTVYEAGKMDDSSATKLGLGMTTLEGLDKDIAALLAEVTLDSNNVYATSSTKLAKKGDTVIISYYKTESGKTDATPELVVDKIKLGEANTLAFSGLIGKNVGNKLEGYNTVITEEVGEGANKTTVTYNVTDVTIREISEAATVKTALGNKVYLTYKKTYTAKTEGAPKVDDVAYTYTTATLDDTTEFLKALKDKEVGTTITIDNSDGKYNETIGGYEYNVTYSGVKVNWIVNSGEELGVVEYTPDEETKLTPVNSTTTVDMKGKKLEYHIYPVYYIPVISEYNARVIVDTILGSSLAAAEDTDGDGEISDEEKHGKLACLADEKYKNGDELALDIAKKLATLQSELDGIKTRTESDEKGAGLDKAWEAYYTAAKAVLNASTPSDAQKVTASDTKKTYEKVKAEYDAKAGEVKTQVDKLLGAGDISEAIVTDYKDGQYHELEEEYIADIREKVSTEVYALAVKYMTFKTDKDGNVLLPEKYVDDVYDRLINDYKNEFYTGTTTDNGTSVKYYDKYNGDFNKFLMDEKDCKDTDTVKTAKALIRKDAEAEVKTLVIIYKLAEYFEIELNDEDFDKIDTIIENMELSEYYYYQLYTQWGLTYKMKEIDEDAERDVEHAYLTNKLFDYVLEEKDAENEEDNKVYFSRIEYDFKSDEAVTE